MKRICLTGGIACGKSRVAEHLREAGVPVIDADDVVHSLLPDPAERKRIAAKVFADPVARKELEARLHPQVRRAIADWFAARTEPFAVAVVPLVFETHWDRDYDIIVCVEASRETQIERMVTTRGYSRKEAEARLAAQMPVAEKAAKSQYVIENDSSPEELKKQTERFISWLKN